MDDAFSSRIEELCKQALKEFQGLPLWKDSEHRLEVMKVMVIPHGYVLYNRPRQDRLPGILEYLRGHGIEPLGRYGRWEYSTMEDAIRQGREAARGL